jgi:hypothetical protein
MQITKTLMLGLVLVVFLGLVAAPALAVTPVWEGCVEGASGTKYESNQCTKVNSTGKFGWAELKSEEKFKGTGSTVSLTDTKATGGRATIECNAGGEEEGVVTTGGAGKITGAKVKEAKTNCTRVSGGCNTGEVESVEGVHLPWKMTLSKTEAGLDVIENSGSGEPGWKIACNTPLGKVTDECVTEGEGKLESALVEDAVPNVLAAFEGARKTKCSMGGKESGELEGLFTLSGTGKAIKTNVGPEWWVNGAPLGATTAEFATTSGLQETLKLKWGANEIRCTNSLGLNPSRLEKVNEAKFNGIVMTFCSVATPANCATTEMATLEVFGIMEGVNKFKIRHSSPTLMEFELTNSGGTCSIKGKYRLNGTLPFDVFRPREEEMEKLFTLTNGTSVEMEETTTMTKTAATLTGEMKLGLSSKHPWAFK